MKAGIVYALWLVIAVLAVVILFQQRKLAEVRRDNASLQGNARAMIAVRNDEAAAAAQLQRELRQLRTENEQLRREIEQLRAK
jgi:Sec-independent protein translocase protein TatA